MSTFQGDLVGTSAYTQSLRLTAKHPNKIVFHQFFWARFRAAWWKNADALVCTKHGAYQAAVRWSIRYRITALRGWAVWKVFEWLEILHHCDNAPSHAIRYRIPHHWLCCREYTLYSGICDAINIRLHSKTKYTSRSDPADVSAQPTHLQVTQYQSRALLIDQTNDFVSKIKIKIICIN